MALTPTNPSSLVDDEPSAAETAQLLAPRCQDLQERSTGVARGLVDAIGPIVESLLGTAPRPAALSRALSIDRTLAARILRALKAEEPSRVLHETPAPQGLRIFLTAAAKAGADARLVTRALDRVREFENLVNEFPGGRSALDAALAGLDPAMRPRTETVATQAVYKSMSCLLGYQCDAMLATIILQPSADGERADACYVMGKLGVRRLRAGAPITVFGRRNIGGPTDDPAALRVETIDGEPAPEHARPYLLENHCSKGAPPLSLFYAGGVYLYTLPEQVPAVNTPVTYIGAQVVRNGFERWRSPLSRHQWETHIPRMPCKVLIADLLVRDDLYPDTDPIATSTLHGLTSGSIRPDAPTLQLDKVDLTLNVRPMGRGDDAVAVKEVPRYPEMLAQVFDKLGWDRQRFRGYRCRVRYPVPLVGFTFWFDLPERS